jgi:lysophospholipase L1-like esterase
VPASVYLALGDSTGVGVGAPSGGGYPQRLLRLLGDREFKLVNLCQSGATSADVLEEQLPRALELMPRFATIGIGINDLGLQIPDDSFAMNLEEIIGRLKAACPRIAITNIPDLTLSPAVSRLVPRALFEQRIDQFNLHVAATAARHGLALVDLFSSLSGGPEMFCADGFHPSAQGYDEWAMAMLPQIRSLLGLESQIGA